MASKRRRCIVSFPDSTKYEIIDLSEKIDPSLLKRNGEYLHGGSSIGRIVHLEEFYLAGWPGVRMHFVRGETHVGTHVESPYKLFEDGMDVASMPLESFVGSAVVVDCGDKEAGEEITAKELEEGGVIERDRVLIRGPPTALSPLPYLTEEATAWLIAKKTRLLAMQNCTDYTPAQLSGKAPLDRGNAHELFRNGVAIVDAIVNLEKIKHKRVFLIALPLSIGKTEASWSRVVALDERD